MKLEVMAREDVGTISMIIGVRIIKEGSDKVAQVRIEDKKVAGSVFTLLQEVAKEVNNG